MRVIRKLNIHLFWDAPDNTDVTPSVQRKGSPGDIDKDILYFIDESVGHRIEYDSDRVLVSSEYCPGVFALADSANYQGHYCDDPANHIDNIPQNHAYEQLTYTYALEINDGIMTIYSDLDENLKINISTEDFKIFHKAYTHVRTTHEPAEFSVTIW